MKFVEDNPLSEPESAIRRLLEIANATESDHAGRIDVGKVNFAFLQAGGTPAGYMAALAAAIEQGWLTRHRSGAYLSFTQAGADLFA